MGVSAVEVQTYTWMPVAGDFTANTEPMVQITEGVDFNVIGREWRCKWSAENDKKSLQEVQTVLESNLKNITDVYGVLGVQRIVCGGCFDFKIIAAIKESKHTAWQENKYAPGEEIKA